MKRKSSRRMQYYHFRSRKTEDTFNVYGVGTVKIKGVMRCITKTIREVFNNRRDNDE